MDCAVSTCPRPLDTLVGGPLCNLHRRQLRRNGSLEFSPLSSVERRPFIHATAKALKDAPVLGEVQQLLESCRDYLCPQADVLRRGWNNKEKARALLATIHRQHGETAALKVLAAFLGTASMPFPTSSPRYFQAQVGRAVLALCKSDRVTDPLTGASSLSRVSCQGWRLPAALFELLDAILWPLRKQAQQPRV
jgi:hypothetical protein